ncbi:related to endo alpha-1,4 polygalactosaminidase [Phialocephala subalpina]|uniref:alpha-galactosidase n=1 Tax=Phialocephala subalpina TaxID=576137 RepID=A0A1L7WQY1_9HELO|nr:related to endo alpha-1,4 polygalactosaminidase [Phialocephala subalpina]
MPSILSISLLALCIIGSCSAWYQPAVGTSWQCALDPDIGSLDLPVEIYDIDLYTNSASVIDQLHQKGKQVICYFSAGTYEPNRPDSAEIKADKADVGKSLADEGWPEENWLNIRSDRIVDIMKKRIDTALAKGCDGVDPDNVDSYDNGGGGFTPPLTSQDSIAYLRNLTTYAHTATSSKHRRRNPRTTGLGIGLKNAGAIVKDTAGFLDWVVNEQCVQYDECSTFQPFIGKGKPVFHIEYKKQSKNVTKDCFGPDTGGFSTIIKPDESDLPAAVTFCPAGP